MARVLMLSSWVGAGHVGLSAGALAVQMLGHEVLQLPTTILSNHPAHAHVAGRATPPETLAAMRDAMDGNGWLAGLDAVLTGYLPSPEHVDMAAETVALVRRRSPGTRVVVDPVLGDAPGGLYLPEDVALALRDRLVPFADVLTPNAFELGWLAGHPVQGPVDALAAAGALADMAEVLVTSPPADPGMTGVLSVGAGGVRMFASPRRDGVPHGVGDVFSALIAAGLPVAQALGHLNALIQASLGAPHLAIATAARDWTAAPPLAETGDA